MPDGFDFPNAPTIGDRVQAPNSAWWRWDGTKWIADNAGVTSAGGSGTVSLVGTGTGQGDGMAVQSAQSFATAAIDTTQAQPIIISGQLALGTETITLERYELMLMP